MANSPEDVVVFLKELAAKAKPFAQKELDEINHYSNQIESIRKVEPWDIPFISEKLKKSRFAIDNEELRSLFPLGQGAFRTVSKLLKIFLVAIFLESKKILQKFYGSSLFRSLKWLVRGKQRAISFLTFSPGKKNAEVHGWMNADQESNTIAGSKLQLR